MLYFDQQISHLRNWYFQIIELYYLKYNFGSSCQIALKYISHDHQTKHSEINEHDKHLCLEIHYRPIIVEMRENEII